MDLLKISTLTDPTSDEVIELLARAYYTNPIHVAAFGGSGEKELQLNRGLFHMGTEFVFRGEWYVALDGSRAVGVLHMARFSRCRLSDDQRAAIGPRLADLPAEAAPRIAEWLGDWEKRDPDTDHWHLGPIAVSPEFQKRGIGRLLLQHFCAKVDESGVQAYLETDHPENVGFYEKSGFSVTNQAVVLGVPNWFMTRAARPVS